MAKLILPRLRSQVYASVCMPLGIIIMISLVALIFSTVLAYSILLGGMIWFFPQGYVVIQLFHRIETIPKRFILVFYKSEIVKLVLVALLFMLVVKWIPASFGGLLGGYLCAQVIFWLYNLFKGF